MALSIQITKFKFHQYELRAVSPNSMLASYRYTVLYCIILEKNSAPLIIRHPWHWIMGKGQSAHMYTVKHARIKCMHIWNVTICR